MFRRIVIYFFFFFSLKAIGQSLSETTRIDSLSVYFKSAGNDFVTRESLVSYFKSLDKNFNGKVVIKGYTDTIGSVIQNVKLATERMRVVVLAIKESKIDSCVIDSINRNENQWNLNIPLHQMRRTDILVYRKEIHFVLNAPLNLNINFEEGTARILPQSLPNVEDLIDVIRKNPKLRIQLNGHVCCGPEEYLSLLRTESVKQVLIKAGIDKK